MRASASNASIRPHRRSSRCTRWTARRCSPPTRTARAPARSNTGEWQTKMGNWHRNLFRGLDHTPDVPMDARLVVVERGAEGSLPRDAIVRWLEAVGLDQSVRRRGIAVMQPAQADLLAGTPGIRVLRPLGTSGLRLLLPALSRPAASRSARARRPSRRASVRVRLHGRFVVAVEQIEHPVEFAKPCAARAIDQEQKARAIRRCIVRGEPDRLQIGIAVRRGAVRQPGGFGALPQRRIQRRRRAPRCGTAPTARCPAASVRPSSCGSASAGPVRVR